MDLRSIKALPQSALKGIKPASLEGQELPEFEWIDPRDVYVEASYQRDIGGENSTTLIRKIYAEFDWSKFKPPVCVWHPEAEVLVCIDGQHTLTACCSHPEIQKIPVMVVTAAAAAKRADAFVGHNRNRLALTSMVVYRAEVQAGDPIAVRVDEACRAAGVTVLMNSISTNIPHPVGSTIAVGAMKVTVKRHGTPHLIRVLKTLVAAHRGPIKAGEVTATSMVYAAVEDPDLESKLVDVIRSKTAEEWAAEAQIEAVASRRRVPETIASLWVRQLASSERQSPGKPIPDQAVPRLSTRHEREKFNDISERFSSRSRGSPGETDEFPSQEAGLENEGGQGVLTLKPRGRPRAVDPVPRPEGAPQAHSVPVPAAAIPPVPENAPTGIRGPSIAFCDLILDPATGIVTQRRGNRNIQIRKPELLKIVAALGAVSPNLLDHRRLMRVAYGDAVQYDEQILKMRVNEASILLAHVGAEIKWIRYVGCTLQPLGGE